MNGNFVVGDMIWNAPVKKVRNKHVADDFQKQMNGATLLKCSELGYETINNT